MHAEYADTASRGPSRGCHLTDSTMGPCRLSLRRRDNLDNVLVLSYTEFVRRPVRGRGNCVKNGCTGEDD
jgi:hypothetical protein